MAILVAMLRHNPAQAASVSALVQEGGLAAQLMAGSRQADGTWLAGLALALEPGWMTYWRNPGEAGVAPRFDWTGSRNFAAATVQWPAPRRFDEGGSSTIGYDRSVVLPITVKAQDQSKPVELALTFAYGVCKTLCVPGQAHLAATLDPASPSLDNTEIVAAQTAVPRREPLTGSGPLTILGLTREGGAAPRLVVDARAAQEADLFVEAPPDWYLGPPERKAGSQPGRVTFDLPLDGAPANAVLPGTRLTLTLAGGSDAIETEAVVP